MSDNKVVKSNMLVQASYKMTLQEQRLILCAISKIDSRGEMEKRVTITAKEFSEIMCIPLSVAYSELLKATSDLYERSIIVRDPEQIDEFRWIESKTRYIKGDGRVSFTWSSAVLKYLSNLRGSFTDYRLRNIISLTSTHAIRLYELLMQFKATKERTILLEDFRFYMGVIDEYPTFKGLNQKVISPSIKQLQKKSGIDISVFQIRDGRKVTALQFDFKEKV